MDMLHMIFMTLVFSVWLLRDEVFCRKHFSLETFQFGNNTKYKTCIYKFKAYKNSSTQTLNKEKEQTDLVVYWLSCISQQQRFEGYDSYKIIVIARVTDEIGRAVLFGLDSYHPVPVEKWGKRYVVLTGPTSTVKPAFLLLINALKDKFIRVTLDTGGRVKNEDYKISQGRLDATNGLIIPKHSATRVYSPNRDLNSVVMEGSDIFGVIAGRGHTGDNPQLKKREMLLEMFPPVCFFSNNYIVPFDSTKFRFSQIHLRGISNYTNIDIIRVHFGDQSRNIRITLRTSSSIHRYTQSEVVQLSSVNDFLVLQFLHISSDSAASAVTIVPPVVEWTSYVILFPLTTQKTTMSSHVALFLIRTEDAEELKIINLRSDVDLKPSLNLAALSKSGYSRGLLKIGMSSIIAVRHWGKSFLVIQYGFSGPRPVYASPAGLEFSNCKTHESLALPVYSEILPVGSRQPMGTVPPRVEWDRVKTPGQTGQKDTDKMYKIDSVYGMLGLAAMAGFVFSVLCVVFLIRDKTKKERRKDGADDETRPDDSSHTPMTFDTHDTGSSPGLFSGNGNYPVSALHSRESTLQTESDID